MKLQSYEINYNPAIAQSQNSEREGVQKVKSKSNFVCCSTIHYVDQKNVAKKYPMRIGSFEARVR